MEVNFFLASLLTLLKASHIASPHNSSHLPFNSYARCSAFIQYCTRRLDLSMFVQICKCHSYHPMHQANNLIKETGEACITDFGLSRVVQDLMGSTFMTSVKPGAMRWAAPELIQIESSDSRISTYSDIYSYGCVVFEVRQILSLSQAL